MPVREGPAQQPPPPHPPRPPDGTYPAEETRGGEIILKSRLQRIIFIGGLVAAAIVAIAMFVMAA